MRTSPFGSERDPLDDGWGDEEDEETELGDGPEVPLPSAPSVARRPEKGVSGPSRLLRTKPMPASLAEKYPNVSMITLTRFNGSAVVLVRGKGR